MRHKYRTEDGYTFYEQPDGSLTDNPEPALADMTFASLDELKRHVKIVAVIEE